MLYFNKSFGEDQRVWFGNCLDSNDDWESKCLMPEATHERNFPACTIHGSKMRETAQATILVKNLSDVSHGQNPHLTCLYNFFFLGGGHEWKSAHAKCLQGLKNILLKDICLWNLSVASAAWREWGPATVGIQSECSQGGWGEGRGCATKSQPASKLGIPGLADYPLACLWLYQREINRTLFDVWHAFIVAVVLSQNTPLWCGYVVTCRDTCRASRAAGCASGRLRVICDRAPGPGTACDIQKDLRSNRWKKNE